MKCTGGALIHCFAGISRSATICIGYLMWKENLSLGAAYSMVERARPCTMPNRGFQSQLQAFESLGSNLDLLDQYNTCFDFHYQNHHMKDPSKELSSDEFEF